MIETWRKKSLPNLFIEAAQVTAENAEEIAAWCGGNLVEEIDPFDSAKRQPGINVPCEYGNERASVGHFVFKAGNEGFRIRKPGEFRSLWELYPKK